MTIWASAACRHFNQITLVHPNISSTRNMLRCDDAIRRNDSRLAPQLFSKRLTWLNIGLPLLAINFGLSPRGWIGNCKTARPRHSEDRQDHRANRSVHLALPPYFPQTRANECVIGAVATCEARCRRGRGPKQTVSACGDWISRENEPTAGRRPKLLAEDPKSVAEPNRNLD